MILIIIAALGLGASIVILCSSDDTGYVVGLICSALFGTLLVCMVTIAITSNSFHDRNLATLQAEREALVYQAENNLYLGDAVGKFNSELIRNQLGHKNPWISWFYGSYWLEVEPIELNKQAEIAKK